MAAGVVRYFFLITGEKSDDPLSPIGMDTSDNSSQCWNKFLFTFSTPTSCLTVIINLQL